MTKPLLMTRRQQRTQLLMASAHLVAPLETTKAPSASLVLKGEVTSDTSHRLLRSRLSTIAAPLIHMLPSLLVVVGYYVGLEPHLGL
jgi:hypothetical protein